MNNSSEEQIFEKLNINLSSANDLLLKEDINLAADSFNNTKFQMLDSPCSSEKLINFFAEFSKDYFSIFNLNVVSLNKNIEYLKELIVSQANPCKVIQIMKCSHKRGGVVVFIHKSLNYKIIHDLSKRNDIVETLSIES